jgi:hypothetical protein
MSRTCLLSLLVGFCMSAAENVALLAEAPLTAKDVAMKVGEKVTVEVVIQSSGGNGEFLELYSEKDWKAANCVFLRFSGPARERFGDVNIADIPTYFMDETIRVTGEVKELDFGELKRPVIYIETVDQIELVKKKRDYTPTEKYQKKVIAGFTVLVHPDVLQQKKAAAEFMTFLEGQLKTFNTSLPKDKSQLLHKVQVWVELEERKNSGIFFHPSALWLKQNGYNPEKAGGVEIPNARTYLQWSRTNKVSGIVHEMSHAFHLLYLGEKNERIRSAYEQAKERKLYESVSFVKDGQIQKGTRQAYAITNEKEYFAEISEAYWGRNDFFPFTRDQLKSHDPVGFELMKDVWLKPVP